MDVKELESDLRQRSYAEIDQELLKYETAVLLDLLDSSSTKVGDSAASLLAQQQQTGEVIHAALNGKFRRRNGKVRAMFVLKLFGKGCMDSDQVYKQMMYDRHIDVVHSALFGLVFLQDEKFIDDIRDAMKKAPDNHEFRKTYETAIRALEERDPFIFSPHFRDGRNVWKLDPERFGHRIG